MTLADSNDGKSVILFSFVDISTPYIHSENDSSPTKDDFLSEVYDVSKSKTGIAIIDVPS